MSSSPVVSNDAAKPEERRALPREALNHYVVLVFFGEDNWGKLTNMSESGMAFEFSKPPAIHERIDFTFQVMGCMPMPRDASVLGESLEAAGEIVWLREFERIAGVQFVDLAEGSREQIRQWLSFETSANALSSKDEAKPEVPPTPAESLAPLTPLTDVLETVDTVDLKEPPADADLLEFPSELEAELESPLAETTLIKEMPKAPLPVLADRAEVVEWQPSTKPSTASHASAARLTFLVVAGCLAAFVVTAAVRMFMARAARSAGAVETAPAPVAVREPTSAGNISPAADASPVSPALSSAESAPPFQVEVLDASGKRWMLWFVRNGSLNGDNPPTVKRTESSNLSGSTGPSKRKEAAQAQEPQATRTYALVAPNINRQESNGSAPTNPSAEAPSIQTGLAVPQGEPIGGALNSSVAPPAPEVHVPVGGMVQQARLIRSVPPIYPELAKSTRVSGDVVVDALIDASGKVSTVKVISGPVLLQQAAIETVRQWKYEPARLDGQAVAMHLSVTVKFRLN